MTMLKSHHQSKHQPRKKAPLTISLVPGRGLKTTGRMRDHENSSFQAIIVLKAAV